MIIYRTKSGSINMKIYRTKFRCSIKNIQDKPGSNYNVE